MDSVALVDVALMRTPILATHLIICRNVCKFKRAIIVLFLGYFVIIADDVTD